MSNDPFRRRSKASSPLLATTTSYPILSVIAKSLSLIWLSPSATNTEPFRFFPSQIMSLSSSSGKPVPPAPALSFYSNSISLPTPTSKKSFPYSSLNIRLPKSPVQWQGPTCSTPRFLKLVIISSNWALCIAPR